MARILTLGNASGISDNDDILVDSPTLGSRRIKAKYFQGGDPVLIDKTITANGTYRAADDDADGYSKVIVDAKQIPEFFGRDLYVGQSGSSYVYPYLDKNLIDNQIYVVTIYDIDNNDTGWVALHWRSWIGSYYQGALKTGKGSNMTVRLYRDKVGLSSYGGSYRKILGSVYRVSECPEYLYKPV